MSGQLETKTISSVGNLPKIASIGGALAAYGMVALGYQLALADATRLTTANVPGFTLLQIAYAGALWWVLKGRSSQALQRPMLRILLLIALTLASSLFSVAGLALDWLLYLVTIAACFLLCPLRLALRLTALLYLLLGLMMALSEHWNWSDAGTNWLYLLPSFGLVTSFLFILRVFALQKERAEQLLYQLAQSNAKLEQAHDQLQRYASEVEELAIVRERTRLARDIHDTLGHYLSLLHIQLGTMGKLYARDPLNLGVEIVEARQLAGQAMHEVRNAVAALRPTSLATLSLPGALAQLGSEFARNNEEVQLTLDLEEQLPAISQDVQMAFYRAAQEALTNVRKHAHASKVLLRLRYEHEMLELVVLDDGAGEISNDESLPGGFGLIGLQERFALLGGQVIHGIDKPGGYRVAAQLHVGPVPMNKEPGEVGA